MPALEASRVQSWKAPGWSRVDMKITRFMSGVKTACSSQAGFRVSRVNLGLGPLRSAKKQLVVDRAVDALGVEEAAAVGRPALALVPVAVAGADHALVGQVRALGID